MLLGSSVADASYEERNTEHTTDTPISHSKETARKGTHTAVGGMKTLVHKNLQSREKRKAARKSTEKSAQVVRSGAKAGAQAGKSFVKTIQSVVQAVAANPAVWIALLLIILLAAIVGAIGAVVGYGKCTTNIFVFDYRKVQFEL